MSYRIADPKSFGISERFLCVRRRCALYKTVPEHTACTVWCVRCTRRTTRLTKPAGFKSTKMDVRITRLMPYYVLLSISPCMKYKHELFKLCLIGRGGAYLRQVPCRVYLVEWRIEGRLSLQFLLHSDRVKARLYLTGCHFSCPCRSTQKCPTRIQLRRTPSGKRSNRTHSQDGVTNI